MSLPDWKYGTVITYKRIEMVVMVVGRSHLPGADWTIVVLEDRHEPLNTGEIWSGSLSTDIWKKVRA